MAGGTGYVYNELGLLYMTKVQDFSWQCGLWESSLKYTSVFSGSVWYFDFIGQNFEEGAREKIFCVCNQHFVILLALVFQMNDCLAI